MQSFFFRDDFLHIVWLTVYIFSVNKQSTCVFANNIFWSFLSAKPAQKTEGLTTIVNALFMCALVHDIYVI